MCTGAIPVASKLVPGHWRMVSVWSERESRRRTAVPPRAVKAAVGEKCEFGENVEDCLPDEVPHELSCQNKWQRSDSEGHTRYSIIKGKMRSLRSQGASLNRPDSGTPSSFICIVFITTGSNKRIYQYCQATHRGAW